MTLPDAHPAAAGRAAGPGVGGGGCATGIAVGAGGSGVGVEESAVANADDVETVGAVIPATGAVWGLPHDTSRVAAGRAASAEVRIKVSPPYGSRWSGEPLKPTWTLKVSADVTPPATA